MLFELGKLVATPGALKLMELHGINPLSLLQRHLNSDWGDLSAGDKRLNDAAVKEGLRILSAYRVKEDKLWVITESDRSSTCILLPEEY